MIQDCLTRMSVKTRCYYHRSSSNARTGRRRRLRATESKGIDWDSDSVSREDVTELIVLQRIKLGYQWHEIAAECEKSKEWIVACLLGQHQMSKDEAERCGKMLKLPKTAVLLLQQVPYKGSLRQAVPTDPLIYRFYELVNIYGTTFKELIHEEFGDGIMSAIDFKMDLRKTIGELGEDRVTIELSGKYLPYKKF